MANVEVDVDRLAAGVLFSRRLLVRSTRSAAVPFLNKGFAGGEGVSRVFYFLVVDAVVKVIASHLLVRILSEDVIIMFSSTLASMFFFPCIISFGKLVSKKQRPLYKRLPGVCEEATNFEGD